MSSIFLYKKKKLTNISHYRVNYKCHTSCLRKGFSFLSSSDRSSPSSHSFIPVCSTHAFSVDKAAARTLAWSQISSKLLTALAVDYLNSHQPDQQHKKCNNSQSVCHTLLSPRTVITGIPRFFTCCLRDGPMAVAICCRILRVCWTYGQILCNYNHAFNWILTLNKVI